MKQGKRFALGRAAALACALAAALLLLAACASGQSSSSGEGASSEGAASVSASADTSASASSASPASSKAVAEVVPDVTSLKLADAKKAIKDAGLKVGSVTDKASDTVEAGCVISQQPKAGKKPTSSGRVRLTVSTGEPQERTVPVPDVRGLTRKTATAELEDMGLVAVYDGEVESQQYSPGLVLKQSIDPGQVVGEGTQVHFSVSKAPSKVVVPNVVGRTAEQAAELANTANLQFATSSEYSSSVAQGLVIRQDPKANTEAAGDSTLNVVVSLGANPDKKDTKVAVPDVAGKTADAAADALGKAGLAVSTTSKYSTSVAEGRIISQKPAAGKKVASGTTVKVVVSLGAKKVPQVVVPDLMGCTWSDAKGVLQGVGLKAAKQGSAKGYVIDQSIAAGTEVEKGTRVTVTLQAETVTVPDIVGMSAESAYAAVEAAGLTTDSTWSEHGVVKTQKPKAGKEVELGTAVSITLDTSEFE